MLLLKFVEPVLNPSYGLNAFVPGNWSMLWSA